MEVVILLAAVAGMALIVIPRLQRRKATGRRPRVVKPRRTAAVVATPAVASSWTPPSSPDVDAWDDDLGWEGEDDDAAPEAREAWRQWRASDSPLAAGPEPELPSVERWRAKAEDDDWLEDDDDGLGWEGEEPRPAAPGLSNGNGSAARPGNGQVPGSGGRDWSRRLDAPRETGSAPAFATASAATDVAPVPQAGRTFELSDDDWDPPAGTAWGVREDAPAAPAKVLPARRRASRVHPVLIVAVYAAVGIGLVVLASTALLGGSANPAPASKKAAATSATPQATATPDTAAAAAAASAAREDFAGARSNAVRSRDAAIAAARAQARREAKARAKARERAKERAAARKRNRAKSAVSSSPSSSYSSGGGSSYTPPPTPTYTPPSNPAPAAPAPKPRRSVCEFCIG